jgi:hypothetical protein
MTATRTTTTTRRIRCAVLCCLAPLAVAASACSSDGPTAAGDPVAAVTPDAEEVSWLASQTAEGGRIEFTDGVATRLVLEGIDPHTIMFSDRPDRLTDVIDTAAITEQWDEMFADSAPNAVLVEHRPDGATDSLVVVLTNPVLDLAGGTLGYDIEVLADEDHPDAIAGLTGDVHDETPTEFRAASLFIDNMEMDEYMLEKGLDTAQDIKDYEEAQQEPIDDPAYAVEDKADEMGG